MTGLPAYRVKKMTIGHTSFDKTAADSVGLIGVQNTHNNIARQHDDAKTSCAAERIVNVWNGLPPSVSFASLSTFRRTIQKVDFSQFMKCT